MLVAETMHDFGRALALVDDHDASERAVGKARSLFRSLGMEHRAELIVAAAAEPAPDGNVFRREANIGPSPTAHGRPELATPRGSRT
jgi:hypothetical protein